MKESSEFENTSYSLAFQLVICARYHHIRAALLSLLNSALKTLHLLYFFYSSWCPPPRLLSIAAKSWASVLLSSLATKPAHHRKGAGSLLLNWATERADGAGLPIYLESSAMGRPLYEKFGFETLQVIETDLEKYGGRGKDKRWLMLRRPQNNGIN